MLRNTLFAAGLLAVTLNLAGCPLTGTTRLTNQGGGALITAGAKIASGALGNLNPDEIQILSDTAAQSPSVPDVEMTDEEAQAVVDFLDANSVNTVADLRGLIEAASEDPSAIVIPDSVRNLFDSGAFD